MNNANKVLFWLLIVLVGLAGALIVTNYLVKAKISSDNKTVSTVDPYSTSGVFVKMARDQTTKTYFLEFTAEYRNTQKKAYLADNTTIFRISNGIKVPASTNELKAGDRITVFSGENVLTNDSFTLNEVNIIK